MSQDSDDLDKKKKIEQGIIPKDTEKLIEEAEFALRDNKPQFEDEVSNINNLIKNKNNETNNFLDIKKTAIELDKIAKEQTLEITNLIESKESEIKRLNEEKIFFERNQIQSDILKNQKLLIEDLNLKNFKLQSDLNEFKKNLETQVSSNKKYLINNNELKNTLDRYIRHNKNLQNTIKQFKQVQAEALLDKSRIKEMVDKIKFYQDDNSRLSNELSNLQKKYETIKVNYNNSEIEKNDIFNQIQELNNSLTKTNIVGTPFVNEKYEENSINSKVLNDISDENLENKKKSLINDDLDEEIDNIFK